MTQYDRGRDFEWKVRDDLTGNGYEVLRAAGSKGSSKVDLVAFKPGQLMFIQAKRSGALPPAEWDRVHQVAGWVGALPILAANGPAGRGVTYTLLLGPKVPYARRQPTRPFLLDEVAGHTTPPTTLADLVDDHGNLPDPCGHCTLVPVADGWHRVRQARCPRHGTPPPPVAPTGINDIPLPGLDTTGGAA